MNGWRVNPVEDVEVTYNWDSWLVTAAWPQRNRRDITTIIRVERTDTDPPRLVTSSTRINLLSASTKTGLCREMRQGEKNPEIDRFVHDICENLLGFYRNAGTTTEPMPQPREGPRYLLYPIWPATEGTLLSAASNSFKSWIAVAIAAQATLGVEILQGNTRPIEPTKILYIDWEGHTDTFGERLYAILRGAGIDPKPCVAYRRLTVAFAEAAESVADEIKRQNIGGVIIDSLSAAVGGSLNDDDIANAFWNSVAMLNVPTLVLAHKSRDSISRGKKAVFGSSMHENRPRFIWDAIRPDMKGAAVKWEVFNDNNMGMMGHKLAWDVHIHTVGENEHRRVDMATFHGLNPNDVRLAANEGDTLSDRITYALISEGPMTAKEIATSVGTKDGSVRAQLSRHSDLFTKHDDGIRWTII